MRQQQTINRLAIQALMIVIIITSALLAIGIPGRIPSALAASAPTYGHSWYIETPTTYALEDLGASQASWSNAHCSSGNTVSFVVLDFGQLTLSGGTYAAYDFGGHFDKYTTVIGLAEDYADTWFADATSCPYLYLAIGTNNYHECPGGGSCDVYSAGKIWAEVAIDVEIYLQNRGESGQVSAEGASDMEAEWDTYNCSPKCNSNSWQQTQYFINGFNYYDGLGSTNVWLTDYGDATPDYTHNLQGGPAWTNLNFWTAAWSGYDVPIPEIYTSTEASNWESVNMSTSGLDFFGVMTECSGSDPLPTGQCWVQGNGRYENSPQMAWQQLTTDSGQTIYYTTNIQWQ